MLESEICFITSTELAARIRAGDLSASEVMEAHLDQIEHTNPRVNAIVTLMPEKAIEEARARPAGRTAARAPCGAQGPGPYKGHPHHLRLSRLRGHSRRRTPCSRAPQGRRCEHVAKPTPRVRRAPELKRGLRETLTLRPTRTWAGAAAGSSGWRAACSHRRRSDMGGYRATGLFCKVSGSALPGRVPTWRT